MIGKHELQRPLISWPRHSGDPVRLRRAGAADPAAGIRLMETELDRVAILELRAALEVFNKAIDALNAQKIQVSFVYSEQIGKCNANLIIGNLRRVEDFIWHGE